MRVNLWVCVAFVPGFLVALLYLISGETWIGVGLAAAVLTALAWQMHPLDNRGVAGGQVRSSANVAALKVLSLFVGVISVLALLTEAALEHWGRYQMGIVAVFALSGLEAMLLLEVRRQSDELLNLLRGADEEELVERELEGLKNDGWIVAHNLEKPYGGNIDHVAVSGTGAFAIETKAGRYRAGYTGQAIGAAMAARELAGVSWVTAVICTPHEQVPTRKGEAWLVGRTHLRSWLREARLHRGRAIDTEDVRARLLTAHRLPHN